MKILSIETSTTAASCAVQSEGKLVTEVFLNHKLHHSVLLFPMLEEVLARAELTMEQIDVIAVSGGPGSFTGLRIGIAAAKGLCLGSGKPFVAISSLDAMAFTTYGFGGIICPMMDALRANVYSALYRWENGKLVKIKDYMALPMDELVEQLAEFTDPILFAGDCIPEHRQLLIEKLGERAVFVPISMTMPRASAIGELAATRAAVGDFDDMDAYAPIYLRKPQAEREYEKKHGVIL